MQVAAPPSAEQALGMTSAMLPAIRPTLPSTSRPTNMTIEAPAKAPPTARPSTVLPMVISVASQTQQENWNALADVYEQAVRMVEAEMASPIRANAASICNYYSSIAATRPYPQRPN